MAEQPDIDDALAESTGPESITVDGITVRQRKASELIEADRYLAAKRGAAHPAKRLSRVQIVPPGAS